MNLQKPAEAPVTFSVSIRMRLVSAARHHIFNHAQVKNH